MERGSHKFIHWKGQIYMRYDTPIYFQKLVRGQYNADTGNYDDDLLEETEVFASVNDTQTEMMVKIYGQIRQGSLSVHIQNHYDDSFDYIRVGNKRYVVDYFRKLKVKESFVLSEVQ